MAKVVEISNAPGKYIFRCPGCEFTHQINTVPNDGPVWNFNKDMDKPTVSPSILVTWTHGEQYEPRRCHSFVRNGMIEFLSDCTHELKGKTVEIPEL